MGEESAQKNYASCFKQPFLKPQNIQHEEDVHEERLINMLDEERLRYAGSIVLGLNDALVELTGALAGLTLALQNVKLIALSGLITGIAASMSMAASEYLSTRSEETNKHPVRAAIYTGIAYIITVALLVLPYLLFENYILDLDHHTHHCRDHYRSVQLLHLGCKRRILPGTIYRDGRLQSQRGGIFIRHRIFHPQVAGN